MWRNDRGRSGRHARQPATSQAETSRSRGPHTSPYSSRTDAGNSPTDGHSVHAYVAGGRWASHGAIGANGGRSTAAASSRATADTRTGPDGPSIAATYASKASRSAGSTASGIPNARPIGRVSA